MELVPILSMIVLVATISTFFLSIGAYVYYKMRERKGRAAKAAQPVAIEAELVTPAPLMTQRRFGTTGLRTYAEEQYNEEENSKTAQTGDVTRIAKRERMSGPIGVTSSEKTNASTTTDPSITRVTETGQKKFMRYTSDGYIDTKEDKNDSEEKLRWR